MKYQYLIELESDSVHIAEGFSRIFNAALDREVAKGSITKKCHCWRRDGEEISQIPFEAQNSIDNKQSESLLCPECGSRSLWNWVGTDTYKCNNCGLEFFDREE